MPIHRLPQSPQNWQVNYGPDGLGDVVRAFQVSFTMQTGKVTASRRIQPHTVVQTTVADMAPSSYVYTNADGTKRWWKHWDTLFKTAAAQVPFTQDLLSNSPSGEDGDLAVFGRTADGLYDILYATNGDDNNIARFNRDVSTTTWIDNYWTGLKSTISLASNNGAGLIRITTSGNHGYATNDTVIIRDNNESSVNGTWRITKISNTQFDLQGSNYVSNGSGGTANRIIQNSTGYTFLGQPDLNSAYPIILKRFSSAQQDLLFVGNDNALHSIDLFGNVVYRRLVFFADYEVTWIQVTKDRVYAGFTNKDDPTLHSYVVEYDPLTETSNAVIANNGQTTGFIYENICHIVDIKGWISRFNANGFSKLAAFSFGYIDSIRFTPVHRNGVTLIDDRPHFLMTGKNRSFTQVLPAGLWCWEPDSNRLYHKGGAAQDNTSQIDYGSSTIGGTAAGTSIAHYGALFPLYNVDSSVAQEFFAGMIVKIITDDDEVFTGTFSTVVASDGAISMSNRGWIITPKFYSRDINAIFRNIVAQYSPNQYPLGRQSGSIVIKYRTSDPVDNASSVDKGHWISTNMFTVTATAVPNIAVGDEIFIVSGYGAGLSAQITAITGGATKTITIDEVILVSFGEFEFVYENWTKLTDETYTDGQINNNLLNNWQFDIPENEASWVQFKVEIRTAGTTPFRGPALEELGIGYQESLRQEGYQRDNV